jgi:hypothetical protein
MHTCVLAVLSSLLYCLTLPDGALMDGDVIKGSLMANKCIQNLMYLRCQNRSKPYILYDRCDRIDLQAIGQRAVNAIQRQPKLRTLVDPTTDVLYHV